ncbi:MAG: penicillin-binding protein 2 [bacterium]|nr:penicillin-binding protein 2 [bacterium]
MSRLFYLQVVRGQELSEQADRQYLKPLDKPFDRGAIFFTNKDGSLFSAATVKTGYNLTINPEAVVNPEAAYYSLRAVLPTLDHDTFVYKANKPGDQYEVIANRLPESAANQIKALREPGFSVIKEKWRFYPGETLAAHTLGFMAYKGDDYIGRYGLEETYNNILSRAETPSFSQFFAQLFLGIGGSFFGADNKNSGDVVSTIEPTVQNFVEGELKKVAESYQADSAGAIVMDPKTGAIYTMVAWPAFNPGDKQGDISVLTNPLVERVFEMGSIIKPLTMSSALDAGVVKPETTYYDAGEVSFNGATIRNFDGKARGTVSMQEVLNQSLNTGAVFAMQQLGRERFKRYMLSFGVGEKTGVELPDEVGGLVSNFRSNREVEYATAAFGQGFAMTPIETVRALSALGNGGYLPPPHLVKEIKYRDGEVEEIKYPVGRRVISGETSETITRMLVKVVDEALRGGAVKLPHYRVAAKTGTAQIANLEAGGYYPDRYLHSFFGYFPAYEPKFIIFMYIVYPKGVKYASETLTTPFMDVTKFLISYYNLPPDR